MTSQKKKNKAVTDEPWLGHPKLSSKQEDRSFVFKWIRDHKLTAPLLKNIWKEDDKITSSSRLIDVGLNGKISRSKALLLPIHKQQRLQWAKDHRDWTEDMWKNVVWSDQSNFNLFRSDGWMYIQHGLSEEFNETVYRAQ